jgi:hypothetical protein
MKLREPKRFNHGLKLDLFPITTEEQFERVNAILHDRLGAKITNRLDGPDARTWKIQIDGSELELNHYSSVGNWIIAKDERAFPILYKIRDLFNDLLA